MEIETLYICTKGVRTVENIVSWSWIKYNLFWNKTEMLRKSTLNLTGQYIKATLNILYLQWEGIGHIVSFFGCLFFWCCCYFYYLLKARLSLIENAGNLVSCLMINFFVISYVSDSSCFYFSGNGEESICRKLIDKQLWKNNLKKNNLINKVTTRGRVRDSSLKSNDAARIL